MPRAATGRRRTVRIVHYGDSHTAADILTAEIRRQFQHDFGNGGAGYMIARNPFSTPRRGVASGATPGWIVLALLLMAASLVLRAGSWHETLRAALPSIGACWLCTRLATRPRGA